MGQIQASTDFATLKTDEDRFRYIKIFCDAVTQQVNGQLEFGANIRSVFVDVTFTAADVTVSVTHNLGRVPSGYIAVSASAALSIYTGSGAWTSSVMFLAANAAGSVKILVF